MWLHTREATTARRPAGTSAPVRTSQTRRRHRSTRRRRREKSGVSYSTKTTPSPPNQAPSGNTDLILPSMNLGKKLEKSIAPNRSLDSSPTPPPPNPPQHKEEPPWRCRHRSRPRRRHQQRSPPNEHHPHELTTEKHITKICSSGSAGETKSPLPLAGSSIKNDAVTEKEEGNNYCSSPTNRRGRPTLSRTY